ncbi:MAG: DNA polymerase III subunit beta [Candidatus Cloacimonadota bacterium]|nr:MAG: DNA polymerase III subunit beta [Candidatus Cloacimonadota bacterium]
MKFSIEKKEIIVSLQNLFTIVPSKNTMPVLMNFLIDADEAENSLTVTATDLDITSVLTIKAMVTEGGKFCVPAKNFIDVINSLFDDVIYFEKNDDLLSVKCRRASFDILCPDYNQYPLVPEISFENAKKMEAESFSKMVSSTSFAVSNDTNRQIFMGLFWKITPNYQVMAATDGKKIAEFTLNGEYDVEESVEVVVPTKGLIYLQKIINKDNPEIQVLMESKRISFKYGNTMIFSHVINGTYPDYKRVMDVEHKKELIVNKKVFLESIKRVALMAGDDTFRVKFDISEDTFIVSAKNEESGDATDYVEDYSYSNEPISIAFNYRFIQSIFNVIETDEIFVKLGDGNAPVLFYNHGLDKNYASRFLLMPLRIT